MKRPNTPAAMAKVQAALDHLQRAQAELGRAAQELSSLRFGHPQQLKVLALYDKVHSQWYRLRDFAASPQSLSVDSEPEFRACEGDHAL